MFAEYNIGLFPVVIIKLKGFIKNDTDFQMFLNNWEYLYTYENDFMMIFDTTDMNMPNIKYCYKLALFIKSLKKSIIIVKNNIILNLLNSTFYLQSPVAPVYLTKVSLIDIILKIDFTKILNMDLNNLKEIIKIDKVINP